MKKITKLLMALVLVLSIVPVHAASLSNYAQNLFIDHILRGITASATTPTSYYVALYTTPCTQAGPGTEVSGGAYARQPIARSQAAWTSTQGVAGVPSTGTSGTVSNANAITFPTATTNWGIVSHFGIVDTSTAGNMILCIPLTTPISITIGSSDSFSIGTLSWSIN